MSARTSKRDSKGNVTTCPKGEKAVRGEKGLKAHSLVCPKTPGEKK